jgi:hypothetical protein
VRGKNIVLLSLIALLFSMTLPLAGAAGCHIRVVPEAIHNEDMSITAFSIDVNVENVEDLYSVAFKIDYAPYVTVLVCGLATEGDFLSGGGMYETDFVWKIDAFHGEIKVGNARLGAVPGASGTGTIARIDFTVVGPGDSPLALVDVELYDSDGDLMSCHEHDGRYYGPEVEFRAIEFNPGRTVKLGNSDSITISTTIQNTAQVPLKARVKYDIIGDDTWYAFYCGQSFISHVRPSEYLYVDGYYEFLEWDWTNPGASVVGMPDGNFAESGVNGAMSSSYTFDDLTLGPGDVIGNVVLEGYSQYPNGATEDVDIDVYHLPSFGWLGSLYGGPDWAWGGTRWIDATVSDVMPWLLGTDATDINNFEALLYNYHGDAPDVIRVDALRLRVDFAQFNPIEPGVYELAPGETITVSGTWSLLPANEGRYMGRAIVEFSLDEVTWVPARKVKDFFLTVKE